MIHTVRRLLGYSPLPYGTQRLSRFVPAWPPFANARINNSFTRKIQCLFPFNTKKRRPHRTVHDSFLPIATTNKSRRTIKGKKNTMENLLEVAPHLHLFNEVHKEYFMRSALTIENDLDCEDLYILLYHDIVQNPTVYFQVIFTMGDIYSERCVGMLCTLASILRQKDKGKKCLQVLELTDQILEKYQAFSMPTSASLRGRRRRLCRPQIRCCRALTYKFNDIRIEACSQMGERNAAVEALRQACQYEIEENYTFEKQKWLVVLFSIAGPSYEHLTKVQLEAIEDESLWQALLHRSRSSQSSGPTFDVDLRKCHGCDKMEKTRGEFEECPKCLKVYYCNYECQLRHHKIHKKKCGTTKKKPLSFRWL
jgi:hypothetical protein